jgi:3',5'-cyclic AMP phosphodiesterase CpdA
LGADQIAQAAAALEALAAQGLFRVVLVHHPITSGVVSGRKALTDQAALREVLRVTGAELVLHGHAHEAAVSSTPGPRGAIPVLGAPSASAIPGGRHAPARWHMIEIDTEGGGVRIIARGFAPGSDHVEELGRYGLPALQG